MEKINNRFKYDDIIEEEIKEKDYRICDPVGNNIQRSYSCKIKSCTGKGLNIILEWITTDQYQVCIEIEKYKSPQIELPFCKNECMIFNNFNSAKKFFDELDCKYNGTRKPEFINMERDSRSVFWKLRKFFKDISGF